MILSEGRDIFFGPAHWPICTAWCRFPPFRADTTYEGIICGKTNSRLFEGGRSVSNDALPVVLKVLHPGLRRQVEMDLLLMKAASCLLHCLPGLKWLSLPEIVDEFEKLMTKQVCKILDHRTHDTDMREETISTA